MNNTIEKSPEDLLRASHYRNREDTVPEIEKLLARLHDRPWRRRVNHTYNLISLLVIFSTALLSFHWTPLPQYSTYHSSQPGSSPEADCQIMIQMIKQQ